MASSHQSFSNMHLWFAHRHLDDRLRLVGLLRARDFFLIVVDLLARWKVLHHREEPFLDDVREVDDRLQGDDLAIVPIIFVKPTMSHHSKLRIWLIGRLRSLLSNSAVVIF